MEKSKKKVKKLRPQRQPLRHNCGQRHRALSMPATVLPTLDGNLRPARYKIRPWEKKVRPLSYFKLHEAIELQEQQISVHNSK